MLAEKQGGGNQTRGLYMVVEILMTVKNNNIEFITFQQLETQRFWCD